MAYLTATGRSLITFGITDALFGAAEQAGRNEESPSPNFKARMTVSSVFDWENEYDTRIEVKK